MVVAVDVDDVLDDLLVQRAVLDREQLRDRQARKHRLLRAQEELAGLAVEHGEAERVRCKPSFVAAQVRHRFPVAITAERHVGVVEQRQV